MVSIKVTRPVPRTVVVSSNQIIAEVNVSGNNPSAIKVALQGIQGPPGTKGDTGQSGAAGSGLDFIQGTPLGTWTLVHNLGRLPAVEIYNQGGEMVFADIFSTPTTTVVSFAVPMSGVAVLT